MTDNVNHPAHYETGKFECIEVMLETQGVEAVLNFCQCNGYQDKTEYVLTPNQQNDNDYSADEIRERYIASDQQKRLSASNSDEDTSD